MRKLKIYIAGAVREQAYREYVHRVYGDHPQLELLDPIRIVEQVFPDVVEKDKLLIEQSDILVAYVQSPSFGTVMEIIYAFEKGVPVYLINPNKEHMMNYWIRYHSNEFFENISDCFDKIIQKI